MNIPIPRGVVSSFQAPQARARRDWVQTAVITLGVLAVVMLACLRFFDGFTVENVAVLSLIAIGGLTVLTFKLLRRYAPKLDLALHESHYERFMRLCGLYRTIPIEVRRSPAKLYAAQEFETLQQQIEEWMLPAQCRFNREDASEYVHNLHLLYLQIAPVEVLTINMPSMRSEFRQAVSTNCWDTYVELSTAKPACSDGSTDRENQLRADATYIVNETRRQLLLKEHVETTRQRLITSALYGWWSNAIPWGILLVIYLFCQVLVDMTLPPPAPAAAAAAAVHEKQPPLQWVQKFSDRYLVQSEAAPTEKEGVTARKYTTLFQIFTAGGLLALAGIAGATGGMLSVIQRVQTSTTNTDATADLRSLSQAESAVFFAPITGMLFAVVLSIIFAGEVINAPIFPKMTAGTPWYFTLWNSTELAKWILWAFIAGFSERLVPDMLNTFAKQAQERAEKGPVALTTERELAAASSSAPETTATTETAPTTNTTAAAGTLSPTPVLYAYADAIPADASELTVSGEGFHQRTAVAINGQEKPVASILSVTESSLRLQLDPGDIVQRESITVQVTNPPPGGGESAPITIQIAAAGG